MTDFTDQFLARLQAAMGLAPEAVHAGGDRFQWWNAGLRQSLMLRERDADSWADAVTGAYRLDVLTDALRGVGPREEMFYRCSGLAGAASAGSRMVHLDRNGGSATLWTSVLVSKERPEAMIGLMAGLARIQAIAAAMAAVHMAEALGGEMDVSGHPQVGLQRAPSTEQSAFESGLKQAGSSPSRWEGSSEFQPALQRLLDGGAKGFPADSWGFVAEIGAVGLDRSSMVRVQTNDQHPVWGSGLEVSLHSPLWGDKDECRILAGRLNDLEAMSVSQRDFHSLGTWAAVELKGRTNVLHRVFLPNALHEEGLVEELVRAAVLRNQWLGMVRMGGHLGN